ncbi:MAG: KxYKxGKxW signal peptide domain-containing protein [Limosilactobacillus sp.]
MNELKHYKMYKAGKLWLTATITVLAFTGMATSVKADNQETAATAPQSVIASNSSASSAASVSAEPVSSVASSTPQSSTATVASSAAPAANGNAQATVSESANSSSPLKDQLDNNLLSEAERFHIFANEVQIGADVNGNIATRHYLSGNEFGTRNESHNYKLDGQTGDVYYIESFDQLGANAFRNSNSHVVFGNDAWGKIEIKDHHVFANGVRLDHLDPDKEKVENTKLIDFDQEFKNLRNLADLYAKQDQTEGVKVDFSDMNNRFIDISGVALGVKTIFVNVPLEYLSAPQPLTIKGLSSGEDGPVVILNVNMGSQTNVFLNTQTKLTYDDG